MDAYLIHHLRAAYRDDLAARRVLLQYLRHSGHGCLAAALARPLAPDVVHLDAWALAQIAAVIPLGEEDLDEVMPWRSGKVACRAVARALEEHTGRPWHARILEDVGLLVGPPRERLLPGDELSAEDREALAERFDRPASTVKGPGLTFPDSVPGLRQCVARAEGRAYTYDPEEAGG